jgi:Ca2+/H+ antiporter, TMEM165/GDT1 family
VNVFWTTFGLIFIAELPDKTAFASVLLATRSNPWAVFVGSSLGFIVHALIAVLLGSALSMLPVMPVQLGAGLLFIVVGIVMFIRKPEEEDESRTELEKEISLGKQVATAFTVIFVAEWGDLTQFAMAALAARYKEPVTVFAASSLALTSVAGLSAVVGSLLKKTVPSTMLKKIAAVVFVLVGVFILVKAIHLR